MKEEATKSASESAEKQTKPGTTTISEPQDPKYETGILLTLPFNGESVIVETQIKGTETMLKRKATWDDAYRIICDAKGQIEAMRTVSHHFQKMTDLAKSTIAERMRDRLSGRA